MKRRRGITLIEVLVAIFIMAIGLLAILTLFPLGALRMAEALQDDRAGAAASEGANLCDAWNVRNDPSFFTAGVVNLYLDPSAAIINYKLQAAAQYGSGYPLYVDPAGLAVNGQLTIGGNANGPAAPSNAFPRVAPSVFPPPYNTWPAMAARYCTLPDDMSFYDNGAPDTSSGNVQRGGRYTWAYLLHRSQPASPSSTVDMTVVVYSGRTSALGETTFGALATAGTTAFGNIGDTAVTMTWPAALAAPNVHRGSWILDTTVDTDPITGVVLGVHGFYYRVVSVTQLSGASMTVEVQIPLLKNIPLTQGAVTVQDNVVDVFSRGVGPSTQWEFRNEQ